MSLFFELLLRLIPLYTIIVLGFISARAFKVSRESIAPLLIYIVNPIVFFFGLLSYEIKPSSLTLPLFMFFISLILVFSFLKIAGCFFTSPRKNLIALAASTGNTGYFGLPVAMMLLGDEVLGATLLTMLGTTVFEQSFGFFITASGRYSLEESLKRTLKNPVLYAALTAIVINIFDIDIQSNLLYESFSKLADKFTGSYSILGMLMIGLGLSQVHTLKPSKDLAKFMSLIFIAKFMAFPALGFLLVYCDQNFMHLFDTLTHKIIMLMTIVPIAANTISFATEFKYEVEEISLTVLLSTIFALFYIPLVVYFLGL